MTSPARPLILGTRGSQLALTQSGHVATWLRELGLEVELRTIKTTGDVTAGSLAAQGGTGVFAAALRQALLDGEVDFAVHSFKDLPTAGVEGLVLAAVPVREDWRDALCARDGLTLAALPEGARVGTGSPRRAAQLRRLRPDLTLVEIRGNVPTRLARATGPDADLDAVVLAAAGLRRLGLEAAITDPLDGVLPAPSQGALAVECRSDDPQTFAALQRLHDEATGFAATVERHVLAGLGAGCAAPVAALCTQGAQGHELVARVLSPGGDRQVEIRRTIAPDADPQRAGLDAASELLIQGAGDVAELGASRPSRLTEFHDDRTALWATSTQLVGRRVLLPRRDGALADALRSAGADVDCVPLTRTVPAGSIVLPADADWLVLSSPTGVAVLADAGIDVTALGGTRVAAVGSATRRALEERGVRVDLTPAGESSAEALVAAFPAAPSGRETPQVVLAGSALAAPTLREGLRAKGYAVESVVTYTTEPVAAVPAELGAAWERADYDAVVLTAGSVARAVVALLGAPPANTAVVAFGRPSAAIAAEVGLSVAATAVTQDGPGLVAALVEAVPEVRESAEAVPDPMDPLPEPVPADPDELDAAPSRPSDAASEAPRQGSDAPIVRGNAVAPEPPTHQPSPSSHEESK